MVDVTGGDEEDDDDPEEGPERPGEEGPTEAAEAAESGTSEEFDAGTAPSEEPRGGELRGAERACPVAGDTWIATIVPSKEDGTGAGSKPTPNTPTVPWRSLWWTEPAASPRITVRVGAAAISDGPPVVAGPPVVDSGSTVPRSLAGAFSVPDTAPFAPDKTRVSALEPDGVMLDSWTPTASETPDPGDGAGRAVDGRPWTVLRTASGSRGCAVADNIAGGAW